VESFIPLWEWDLPKKKSKKKKGERREKDKGKGKKSNNGTSHTSAYVEEVEDSGSADSRPGSRTARIEEVEDEDA
jgi:translocation protein SEC62